MIAKVIIMKTKYLGNAFVIILTEKEQEKKYTIITMDKQNFPSEKKAEKKYTKIIAGIVLWWDSC